jgi:glucokinase
MLRNVPRPLPASSLHLAKLYEYIILNCTVIRIANNTSVDNYNILAGDVGATKSNLAIFNWDGHSLNIQKQADYKSAEFKSIISMLSDFLVGETLPEIISLGIAGPVNDSKVTMTNTGWIISRKEISEMFGPVTVLLINDLEATAYSLAVISEKDIHVLYDPESVTEGNIAIISPGTGLGEAGLYYNSDGYHPFATEGGHCDFAPRTELDIELYRYLNKKFSHVSWEKVISGPGISLIYDFLHHEKEREEPSWLKEKMLAHDKAIVISEQAEDCGICRETMDLFIRFLAEESANLVLKLKATGGLFIAGGIIPHLLNLLHKGSFMKWFTKTEPMENLLKAVPVRILLNEKLPLLGAAYYGALSR